MKKGHVCEEGEPRHLEFAGYPRAVTYCRHCHVEMRRIPVDDLEIGAFLQALDLIKTLRDRRKERPHGGA